MADIWRTTDRLGREVTLTEAGWAHIVRQRRDAVPTQDEVRAAVADADLIVADVDFPRRRNHYRRRPAGGRYLKVVVNYRPVPPQGTWAGEVVTAHPAHRPKPE